MAKKSAGLLMYRRRDRMLQVFLIHPGGPFWKKKDLGAWSIPKGEYTPEENPLSAAKHEFKEETGFKAPEQLLELTPIRQPSGKVVAAWAFEGDADPAEIKSNTFSQQWPPRSGKHQTFPEVDRAAWFDLKEAKRRILKGQIPLVVELERKLSSEASLPTHQFHAVTDDTVTRKPQ